MELGLTGRVALVTGASKGIGAGIARALAAEGVNLHLVARRGDVLAALADELRAAHGVDVTAHAADLGQSGAPGQLAAVVGAVDILVNNAGAIPGGDLFTVDDATWRQAWDLKVFGYIDMCRQFYPAMQERGRGVIVNVIGLAGERPDAGYIAGSAGNAALMAFTRALGGRSPDHGIRVVGVNPGPVETDRIRTLMQARARDKWGDASRWAELQGGYPFGRAAKVAEIADQVAFLASDRAGYTSGTIVTVDGGATTRGR